MSYLCHLLRVNMGSGKWVKGNGRVKDGLVASGIIGLIPLALTHFGATDLCYKHLPYAND